jgi:hypothetical protein
MIIESTVIYTVKIPPSRLFLHSVLIDEERPDEIISREKNVIDSLGSFSNADFLCWNWPVNRSSVTSW